MNSAVQRTLADRMSRVSTRSVLLSLAMAASLGIAAQIRIPLPWTPVPVTLQTLVLLLGAAWLGSGRSIAAVLVYMGATAAGLPLLSGFRGGFAALVGPTGGYVVGWLLAAYLIGHLVHRRRPEWPGVLATFLVAEAVVFTCGLLHLVLFLGVPWEQGLWMGLWPFLPGDLLKVALATALYRARPELPGRIA